MGHIGDANHKIIRRKFPTQLAMGGTGDSGMYFNMNNDFYLKSAPDVGNTQRDPSDNIKLEAVSGKKCHSFESILTCRFVTNYKFGTWNNDANNYGYIVNTRVKHADLVTAGVT